MRARLVKYTEFLDFQVKEELSGRSSSSVNLITIKWKLPNLTDEQEAAIRDEINSQFRPQDSSLMKEKIVEWKIGKRKYTQWYFDFKLVLTEVEYEFEKKICLVNLNFHDGNCGSFNFCSKSPQTIKKGADVEFLLQIGNSSVLFSDLRHSTRAKCIYGSESFTQYDKSVPVDIFNQVRDVPRDQIQVTVLGTFPDDNQGMDLGSNFDWFTSPKPNWTGSYVAGSDVTIWTDYYSTRIFCHSNIFTRNSRVLSDLLVSPSLKPFEVHLRDMSTMQVVAFLMFQYHGVTDKILEAPVTTLGVLKAAKRYEIRQMWTDTIKGLLQKDSEWFEGEAALKLANFLRKCSKREEETTKKLILKISQELRRQSPRVEDKSGNEEGEEAGENGEPRENGQVEETREAGDNESESGCHNLNGNKIRRDELAQLKSKLDPVSLLKFVQCYKNDSMWNDIILTLLEKDSGWFEWDLALELKTFLDSCFKRHEEATQKLRRKLTQLLEQPKPIGETTQGREEEDQNGEIAENTRNSQPEIAKLRKVTTQDPDQLIRSNSSRVGTATPPVPVAVTRTLRRSIRLQVQTDNQKNRGLQTEEEPQKEALRPTAKRNKTASKRGAKGLAKPMKRKPVQKRKRGLLTEDETWKRALQVGAENERNAFKSAGARPGPRDIWKDPLLPKISIFPDIPDPEVKVEKVEPPEEESEDSPGMDGVQIQQVVQDQDCVEVIVKEEEPILMDESSPNDNESAGYGVIESSWSLRQPTDENI